MAVSVDGTTRSAPVPGQTKGPQMTTFAPASVILYVADVLASTNFYRTVLGKDPVATFDGFAVFSLTDGVDLGLQSRDDIDPPAQGAPGSVELSMSDVSRTDVDDLFQAWSDRGLTITLAPTELAFGYTFVATDPDGHRLRVCATDTTGLD